MPQTNSGAVFFGLLTQRQKEEVLRNVAKDAAARFQKYFDTILESVGLPDLSGSQRLAAFRARAPEIWQHLQTNFPLQYEKQLVDWRRLETATLRNPNYQHTQESAVENASIVPSLGGNAPSSSTGGVSEV